MPPKEHADEHRTVTSCKPSDSPDAVVPHEEKDRARISDRRSPEKPNPELKEQDLTEASHIAEAESSSVSEYLNNTITNRRKNCFGKDTISIIRTRSEN